MKTFLDIHQQSLNHQGEQLCGDQAKVVRGKDNITIVLSDGLGSGVKANILATLTTEILATMLREGMNLKDVLETVVSTLPTCQVRKIAYATFTILQLRPEDNHFTVINFDNPPPLFLKQGVLTPLDVSYEEILGKEVAISDGYLELGDFIGLISDGVLYAGLGQAMNFGWGWENIGHYIEEIFAQRVFSARTVVNGVISKTRMLYQNEIGDDATFVGVFARNRHALMVFTGPPQDECHDFIYVDKLLDFEGRKAVCGGTTGNIVASFLNTSIETDISTLRENIPPIGRLPWIDLVTEGIITIALTLDHLRNCRGDISKVEPDNNGAYLLTRELLMADEVDFLVGNQVNPVHHNPALPNNVSVRRYLVEQIADELRKLNKDVSIEFC